MHAVKFAIFGDNVWPVHDAKQLKWSMVSKLSVDAASGKIIGQFYHLATSMCPFPALKDAHGQTDCIQGKTRTRPFSSLLAHLIVFIQYVF